MLSIANAAPEEKLLSHPPDRVAGVQQRKAKETNAKCLCGPRAKKFHLADRGRTHAEQSPEPPVAPDSGGLGLAY